jgi:signal transduction histidine kinase
MGKRRLKFDFLIHDLKGPLAVMEAGVTSLLERRDKYGALTGKQEELGRSSEGVINENKFILSSFVEQSLLEIFDLTDYKAAESINACVNLTALKKRLAERGIVLDVEEDLWCQEVCLDASKMRQILRNLLNNALKYRKKQVDVKIEKSDESLLVCVSDDGEGIPASYHQKIFECYFQMDSEREQCIRGHGLGLAGVMILVEDMGGNLFLESDVGKGAKFQVKVPMNRS